MNSIKLSFFKLGPSNSGASTSFSLIKTIVIRPTESALIPNLREKIVLDHNQDLAFTVAQIVRDYPAGEINVWVVTEKQEDPTPKRKTKEVSK